MIEIDLLKLERGTREGQVKVRRGGKIFYRKQRLGQKETGEPKKAEVQYVPVPGLVSELPTYDSMPDTVRIPSDIVANMYEAVEASTTHGDAETSREIFKGGDGMVMDKIVYGAEGAGSVPIGNRGFGSYHTHPGFCLNSFSWADMMCFIIRKHKIMIAHDINSDGIWVAIKSAETEGYMADSGTGAFEDQMKESKSLASGRKLVGGKGTNNYRWGIKDFCEGTGIKLYYGAPGETIKEYTDEMGMELKR
jgi:hypothetical protein